MAEETRLIYKYLRHDKKFPHVWCPGCGNGILLGSLIRAVDAESLKKDDVVLISGIGCSGRLAVYVDFNTLHTTHGRALTFATGVKLANPSLHVIVVMGDGDATAIGGNHLIHAARRNIDLTAIIVNNNIYGMTGGQYSPTTPYGSKASTSPYGNIEHSFDISELAITAGAVFVGRGSVYHTRLLDTLIRKALQKRGFSVVEVISQCNTLYGRYNRIGSAVDMMRQQKEDLISVARVKNMKPEELQGKIVIGVLTDKDLPLYQDEYSAMRARAQDVVVKK
ncbi:MAG: 2-oxoacid:ferredoxin oxidoreductase subunit beta [Deltaproteobacteria bacterium]|nr:2-oxoacid:ferredoxin oxidoreductase subunit beta [Deltaproteobacteria bacterium]MBW2307886.1 2-oxoacid:ferredoxin oxidoreductase subunit beta [Deltaproteobacteria bacterium]